MSPAKKNVGLGALATPSPAALDAFVAGTPAPAHQHARASDAPVEAPQGVSLVAAAIEPEEPTQRLTLEIPLSLHVAIKSGCAMRRTKIKEEVLKLLEAHYRPQG